MQALCRGMVGKVVDGELQSQHPQEACCMEQQPRRGTSWLGKAQIWLFQQGVQETQNDKEDHFKKWEKTMDWSEKAVEKQPASQFWLDNLFLLDLEWFGAPPTEAQTCCYPGSGLENWLM